jgi:Xaa-Pro aminopeptidase
MADPRRAKESPYAARRRRLAGKLRRAKVDALLVTKSEDVRYLSGFTGEDSFLLVAGEWACLLTDGRFDEQARGECGDIDVHVRRGAISTAVGDALKGRRVRRLGFQPENVTLVQHDAMAAALKGKRLRPVKDAAASARMVKDAAEVAAIERAIRIGERAFEQMLAAGVKGWVGRTERELAAELEYRMRQHGAEGASFETIVATGAHGSLPHHRPGGTRVKAGDAVLVDWGAKADGYCGDLTRVVFTGRIPPQLGEVYEVVRRAQQAGIAAVKAGAGLRRVDAAAREVIESAGYGKECLHGLGHGVGLEIHEAPSMGKLAKGRLRSGMVVTVEPGIYLPGVGGVRIEDDVLVAAEGCRRLSRMSREASSFQLPASS